MKVYKDVKHILHLLWKDDDLMEQETLFELQAFTQRLALKTARTEHQEEDLLSSFPYLYSRASAKD